ncbi:MAG: tRNA (adenosine(37)-N6)-dimethylallyltransferase MiaA [Spirochaetaceae bacterium]|nr:tRNA (adenosine(37)-N6)-dimethylallyltransferase MiaA [Spirochaetaceae bacterium]
MLQERLHTSIKDNVPLILIFGPTAVGKTDLLLNLFEGKGEVISADSMQVYKGLDIGSAKPDSTYLKRLPHHLINIKQPQEQFSAGDFVDEAEKLIPQIKKRGKIPVLSGGTAFYFRNFIFGLPKIPFVDVSYRLELNEELKQNGLDLLYEELCVCDPGSGVRLNNRDSSRIIRALEVFRATGRALSSYPVSDTVRNDYSMRIIGLERDRKELYSRINKRVDIMFDQGLINEIKSLITSGVSSDYPSMKGIGYSEFFEMYNRGCMTVGDLKDKIKQDSRRYAKRQITFFKSLKGVKWFSPLDLEGIKREVFE